MVLVTVSLMMRSIVRLRWINLAGGVLFAIYGLAIAARYAELVTDPGQGPCGIAASAMILQLSLIHISEPP